MSSSTILTINGGSSSIKFALYEAREPLTRLLAGKLDRIGLDGAALIVDDPAGKRGESLALDNASRQAPVTFLLNWLAARPDFGSVIAVSHRVTHGMQHRGPARVTPSLMEELRGLAPLDPDHLPREIELIECFTLRHPHLSQIACFDTAFHRAMPSVAKRLPIPRRYAEKGVERYGFHGLSYAYLMGELERLGDPSARRGRVILAHLGGGASLAAVRDGESIDTSMGFTPASGLMMGNRSGDLDPGIAGHLARTENMTPEQFQEMTNRESGLLGISGTTSDARDLLAREPRDIRAAEALELFCYQAKKWIGAFAATLGGLDTLVFAGGIGENSPLLRARICEGLDFLGVDLNEARNAGNAPLISADAGRVSVRVIRTDEEIMLARFALREIASGPNPESES